MRAAYIFFAGTTDLFLSVMLWFILDWDSNPAVVVDGVRVYAVADVIKQRDSGINSDCDRGEQNQEPIIDRASSDATTYSSEISKSMINQFFTEIEGPDRDWQQEDTFYLLEEDQVESVTE